MRSSAWHAAYLVLGLAVAALDGCGDGAPAGPSDALRFTLSGTVTDVFLGTGPRGNGLAGVTVTITSGPSQGSATTDARGHYSVANLLAGVYGVTLAKDSYQTATSSVQFVADTTLSTTLALSVPAVPAISDLTGYWSGEGSYPNAPFRLALVHQGDSLRGTYADRHDEGPVDLWSSPPPPLPPYTPGHFTLAVQFGDAILYLECVVEDGRRITGAQRTSALGWSQTFPFTMTR